MVATNSSDLERLFRSILPCDIGKICAIALALFSSRSG
jgi:hypothetical protein